LLRIECGHGASPRTGPQGVIPSDLIQLGFVRALEFQADSFLVDLGDPPLGNMIANETQSITCLWHFVRKTTLSSRQTATRPGTLCYQSRRLLNPLASHRFVGPICQTGPPQLRLTSWQAGRRVLLLTQRGQLSAEPARPPYRGGAARAQPRCLSEAPRARFLLAPSDNPADPVILSM
jgi:hypothetical protein